MKRIILLLILPCLTIIASATGVCTFGSQASLYTTQFEGNKYLVLGFDEVKNKYTYLQDTVIIKFQFADGNVLRLKGYRGDSKKVQASIDGQRSVSQQLSFFIYTYFVVFPITQKQIDMFKGRAVKAVVNTIPTQYRVSNITEEWTHKVYDKFAELEDDFDFN